VKALKAQLAVEKHPAWVIFDNSASGAALQNALMLRGACTSTYTYTYTDTDTDTIALEPQASP
jgi:uncharacterized protein YecE (DUF72 family)